MVYEVFGILLGVTIIAFAIWDYLKRLDIIKNKIEVNATVIRLKKTGYGGGDGGPMYSPVFQYYVDGVEFKKIYPTTSDKHIVGFTTTVYCHKNKPQKSLLPDQLKKEIALDIIFLWFGVFLIVWAIFF
ncbi:MAG: hypothetical protein LBC73_05275 [Oscillospiraceae bacterium]|jgi:hypothetical protein|nr:hypothetical protein [Oscillospiraceae bacterium]